MYTSEGGVLSQPDEQTCEIWGEANMDDKDLAVLSDVEPFEPVGLRLSNGASCAVTHPESVLVSKCMAASAVGDSLRFTPLAHSNEVESLPTISA